MKLNFSPYLNLLELFFIFFLVSCTSQSQKVIKEDLKDEVVTSTSLVVLGTVQDAGSPQIGCKKSCCKKLFETPDNTRKVVSLGLIDAKLNKTFLFEATPDIVSQMKKLTELEQGTQNETVDGIFLTHAHIGHYTGLMYLGKEAMDAKAVPVYAMSKMKKFLLENGPWDQLVKRQNIQLKTIQSETAEVLSKDISVTPFLVPHRDEYSETVGYRIQGPNKTALFVPDIDKWEKWNKNIIEEIKKVDYAFLDATFFDANEINNRDISEIPHPFVIESLDRFKDLSREDKSKIIFIHFNHTNPLLDSSSEEFQKVLNEGFNVAQYCQKFRL